MKVSLSMRSESFESLQISRTAIMWLERVNYASFFVRRCWCRQSTETLSKDVEVSDKEKETMRHRVETGKWGEFHLATQVNSC